MDSKPLLICNEQEKRRIVISSILYIGTDDYLSTFYLKDCQKFTCSKPLSEITNGLPNYFFQISRSCTVNLNEILSVKRGSRTISLSNATQLVVSNRRFKGFNDSLAKQNITFTG